MTKTKQTIVIERPQDLIEYRKKYASIGFVPTMGALHEGHATLMRKSSSENELTIASVFVNPTQFNNSTDLEKYPKTFENDLKICSESGVDILFFPQYSDIYPDNYRFKVTENEFSKKLCGTDRPGHFDGVLTVVLKLFQITGCTKSYFGLKDHQQYKLVSDMAKGLFLSTEVIGIPTVREASGLAMSSRNLRLSAEGKDKASLIYKTITQKITPAQASEILTANGFTVNYLEDIENRRYVAASLEGIRLIDNVEI
ncbi:pantoate--beta-alanine ligase [Bdellovibrio sp. qaytius]|nr:pantoate--beta-alanine ligase [Bdellovibrio sp. qaytius]